jgi:hypothetical protein
MLDQIDAVHYIKAGYTPLAVEFIYEDARVHGRSVKEHCQAYNADPFVLRALAKRWGIRVKDEQS